MATKTVFLPGYGIVVDPEDGNEVFLPGYGVVVNRSATITIEQEGFRWRNDDGSESAATWRQNQDVDETVGKSTTIRLRTLLNAAGDPATKQYQLEYKEAGDAAAEYRKVPLS